MLLDQMHPEDVKAAIRKRFGSIAHFVEVRDLPETGVSDLFRGRTSKRVREAVEEVLREAQSINLDVSSADPTAHRLNAEVHQHFGPCQAGGPPYRFAAARAALSPQSRPAGTPRASVESTSHFAARASSSSACALMGPLLIVAALFWLGGSVGIGALMPWRTFEREDVWLMVGVTVGCQELVERPRGKREKSL